MVQLIIQDKIHALEPCIEDQTQQHLKDKSLKQMDLPGLLMANYVSIIFLDNF